MLHLSLKPRRMLLQLPDTDEAASALSRVQPCRAPWIAQPHLVGPVRWRGLWEDEMRGFLAFCKALLESDRAHRIVGSAAAASDWCFDHDRLAAELPQFAYFCSSSSQHAAARRSTLSASTYLDSSRRCFQSRGPWQTGRPTGRT